MSGKPTIHPLVRRREAVESIDCPFGHVQRIVTGGEGGIANVHVVKVARGLPHRHQGYHEVYYFLSGTGTVTINGETSSVSPGSVAVIPAGAPHGLEATPGEELEFVIFGTPPMPLDDERAKPRKVSSGESDR
ncbi:MAG: cupin domain-containing protein [Planctomycetota bacterium]